MTARLPLLFALFVFACSSPPEPSEPDGWREDLDEEVGPDASDDGDTAADALPDVTWLTPERILDAVDPFIGTGGVTYTYAAMTPAAQWPLGMVRVGPDTTDRGSHSSAAHHFSGFYRDDPQLRGFSHTHFVGTGAGDYGNLRLLPATEDIVARTKVNWFATPLLESDTARPGSYAVSLEEPAADVQLVATTRGALHRYTWAENAPRLLVVDLTSSVNDSGVQDAQWTLAGDTLSGFVTYKGGMTGRRRPFTLFVSMTFSQVPTSSRAYQEGGLLVAATGAGVDCAAVLAWARGPEPLEVRVGVSFIDAAQAEQNRVDELDGKSLETLKAEAETAWLAVLTRVRIPDSDLVAARTFYTALYNTYRMPTRLDEGGRYRGLDGEVHDYAGRYFTDLSLWDTYRTLNPWFTLYDVEVGRDILNSLLQMGRDGGYIPRWPAALSYSGAMEGDCGAMLFAEGALKGIDGVDYDAAYDLLLKTAYTVPTDGEYGGREGIEDFIALGWVPADLHTGSASNTLEYSVNDFALARLAEHLGRPEAAEFDQRAQNLENIWDPETRFFRPRKADGSFTEPFIDTQTFARSGDFVEGSPWHYRFWGLHDPSVVAELFGDADTLVAELDTFFDRSNLLNGHKELLILADPYYWHTNQPSLHSAFMYAAVDRLDRLGYQVRRVQRAAYDNTPAGLIGNDDGGTLSSWYVMSALGFYPIVATDRWVASPPLFEVAEVDLPGGAVLRVEAPGATTSNGALASAFSGAGAFVNHATLAAGGVMRYEFVRP